MSFYLSRQYLIKKVLSYFLIFLGCHSSLLALDAREFDILTYKEPPFVMFDEGILYGVATDVINEALLKFDIEDYYIRIYPKKRTEFYAGSKKGTMYFPALKTEKVLDNFELVGPIIKTKVFAYSLEPLDNIETIEDLKDSNLKVAVASGSRQHELLQKTLLAKNIQAHPSEESNIEKLKNDRVDIWVTTDLNAAYLKQRKQVKNLYPVYELDGFNELFLAIHKESNPEIVDAFNKVFNSLNTDGVIQKVQGDFLKNLEIWSQSSF